MLSNLIVKSISFFFFQVKQIIYQPYKKFSACVITKILLWRIIVNKTRHVFHNVFQLKWYNMYNWVQVVIEFQEIKIEIFQHIKLHYDLLLLTP